MNFNLVNVMSDDFEFAQVETEVRTLKFDDTGMFLLAGRLSGSFLQFGSVFWGVSWTPFVEFI